MDTASESPRRTDDTLTWLLFPALVGVLTTYAVIASRWHLATHLGLPDDADGALIPLTALILFYPLIALLEWLHPYRTQWQQPQGDVMTDILHITVSGPMSSGTFNGLLHGLFTAVGAALALRFGVHAWPSQWPALLQLALAVLIAEFGHYWFHRLTHERPLLWRLHAVHHSSTRLYWLNATRFHPLDLFCLIAAQTIPLLVLAADRRALLMYAVFSIAYGQLQHANIKLATPQGLDRLFSTPGLHRWHHSTDTREGNANYGAIFSFWDLVFGTFFRPSDRQFEAEVGLSDQPNYPTTYGAQLMAPFRN